MQEKLTGLLSWGNFFSTAGHFSISEFASVSNFGSILDNPKRIQKWESMSNAEEVHDNKERIKYENETTARLGAKSAPRVTCRDPNVTLKRSDR